MAQLSPGQCLVLPPSHLYLQKRHRDAYEGAIADLKYGAIAVNCPGLVAFAATKLGWGGYPGHTPQVGEAGL